MDNQFLPNKKFAKNLFKSNKAKKKEIGASSYEQSPNMLADFSNYGKNLSIFFHPSSDLSLLYQVMLIEIYWQSMGLRPLQQVLRHWSDLIFRN